MAETESPVKGKTPVKESDPHAEKEVRAVVDAAADFPLKGPSIGAVVNGIRKGRA